MPVPVQVIFEDATRQTKFTDRLLDINVLEFESSALLKEILLDLLSRRDEAIKVYQEAWANDTGHSLRRDQYGIVIDRGWVEERLRTPFERR